MALKQLVGNVSYVDLVLLLLMIASWVFLFRLRKERGKSAQLTRQIEALRQQQKDLQEQFEQRVTDVTRSITKIRERNDAILTAEVKKIASTLKAFSQELKQMKAFLHERSIDLEL